MSFSNLPIVYELMVVKNKSCGNQPVTGGGGEMNKMMGQQLAFIQKSPQVELLPLDLCYANDIH